VPVTQTLSTVPMVVDVHHYGGDTLNILVVVDVLVVAGRDWDAQVRRPARQTPSMRPS
jgi:hypothetical protein